MLLGATCIAAFKVASKTCFFPSKFESTVKTARSP